MEKTTPPEATGRKQTELPTISSTLLNEVQQMNSDAWARLVQTFGPIVYRWCRQAGLPGHDASDVVQEVFTSVSRNVADFHRSQADQSFRNWLATITRNRIRDYFRKQSRVPKAAGGTEALRRWQDVADSLESSISGEQLETEITQRVMDLVRSEFEERSWLAFHATVVQARSPADVAADLNMNVAAVYQAKSRILRRLRQRLAELPK